jgi:diguanylate cyclase (GGDEF)-like protein
MERMAMAIQHADEQGTPLALLMLDLDRFKEVNDTLGHHAGDTLLCEVAKRLATERRTTDTIARLGGDEFAVVLPAICNVGDAVEVARRMIHVLREPFEFNGLIIEVGVSIGIALFPDHAFEKDKLLQCADVAMYAAKQAQCSFAVYNYEKDHNSIRHLTISGQLRRAIEDRQIDLVYQPQLDLTSLRPVGVEALARWDHPVHGPISPVEFILHAERTGLIHDLTVLILDTALAQARAWHEAGRAIAVSVNISAKGLHNSGFPRIVADALTRWGITPRLLTLEITESAIMIDPPKALRMAKAMAEMGLRLSIDDFGTGYSSLSYLSHLPASELKIDKSFVSRMIHKRQDAAIVHSTIDLAHNLDLKVVAEGVEGVDILSLLAALGCDFGQGYYIGLPMTAEAASAWFEAPLAMDMVPFAGRKRISV